ncbi:MAG: hypothetical protein A2Y25_05665 [Candidatus Melainabacteria bacterium GWF2_37_15]|nr:MAG: hypothetical protein A2Y25_05665 [Candidatus Melainabacteria bacterium GWF2_37_15]
MRKEILELEQILEQEITACSELEKYITEKKNCLVKGDLEGLIKTDIELEKYNEAIIKLEEKRKEIYPDNPPLHIKTLKEKLKKKLTKIENQNTINAELLKHALKVIEGSILSITKVLVPESSSYNSKGKINKDENIGIISSIVHEA